MQSQKLSLVYLLAEKVFSKSQLAVCLSVFLSLVAFYLTGSLWYAFVYNGGEGYFESLSLTVLPFVIPDILKVLLARAVSLRVTAAF